MEKRLRPCPQCGKRVDWDENHHKPFCSERCKMIDLGMWAQEEYRIPDQTLSKENLEALNEQEKV